jgi:hypothetical protein
MHVYICAKLPLLVGLQKVCEVVFSITFCAAVIILKMI